jgi:hypothetical protein
VERRALFASCSTLLDRSGRLIRKNRAPRVAANSAQCRGAPDLAEMREVREGHHSCVTSGSELDMWRYDEPTT